MVFLKTKALSRIAPPNISYVGTATISILVWKLRQDLEEIRRSNQFGFSCAQRFSWKLADTPVTYSKLLDSNTNLDIPAINLTTGVFTASSRKVFIYFTEVS